MKTQAETGGAQPRVKGRLGPPEAARGGRHLPLGPVHTSVSDFWPPQLQQDRTGQDSLSSMVRGPVLPWPRVRAHGSRDPRHFPWPSRQAEAEEVFGVRAFSKQESLPPVVFTGAF